jgi:ribosomal protein S18 acetylase RimI-like enzyme
MNSPTINLLDVELSPEMREAVCAPLRNYNRSKNAEFFTKRELPENAARHLNLIARNESGQIVGGLIAETQFSWLKIEILSVADNSRRQGTGTMLMNAAETEARARGSRYAFLDTMSYQAPGFYEKLGYTVAGKLDDWDSHGNTKLLFVKRLNPTTT